MIYARSLAPIQDTPSVKFTWDATVTITPNVGENGFFMPGDYDGVEEYEDDAEITFKYS
jgi:aminopeptidase N